MIVIGTKISVIRRKIVFLSNLPNTEYSIHVLEKLVLGWANAYHIIIDIGLKVEYYWIIDS